MPQVFIPAQLAGVVDVPGTSYTFCEHRYNELRWWARYLPSGWTGVQVCRLL